MNMCKCKDCCDQLSEYLDGEIDPCDCKEIEQHLEVCVPCSLIYESLKATLDLCAKGIPDDMPQEAKERLRQFLRTHCNADQS